MPSLPKGECFAFGICQTYISAHIKLICVCFPKSLFEWKHSANGDSLEACYEKELKISQNKHSRIESKNCIIVINC